MQIIDLKWSSSPCPQHRAVTPPLQVCGCPKFRVSTPRRFEDSKKVDGLKIAAAAFCNRVLAGGAEVHLTCVVLVGPPLKETYPAVDTPPSAVCFDDVRSA